MVSPPASHPLICSAGPTYPVYKFCEWLCPRPWVGEALGHGHSESHQFYDPDFRPELSDTLWLKRLCEALLHVSSWLCDSLFWIFLFACREVPTVHLCPSYLAPWPGQADNSAVKFQTDTYRRASLTLTLTGLPKLPPTYCRQLVPSPCACPSPSICSPDPCLLSILDPNLLLTEIQIFYEGFKTIRI